MPSARSAATDAASRRLRARQPINRPHPAPKGVHFVRSLAGLRWDRMGRTSLLLVLVVVSLIGVQRVLNYLSTRAQAAGTVALVHQLTKENARLQAQQRALSQPATIAAAARRLGMVRIGEHPYAVTSNH
jgi:cell division protein FtsB